MTQEFNIDVLIATYNDHVSLPYALDSIKDVADSIIVADGAYYKYYLNYLKYDKTIKPWSTDGTLQMLECIPNLPPIKLIECPNHKPWMNQTEKRTALLKAVPDKDWFLILDSDEMFYGNVKSGVYEIMSSGCIAGFTPIYNLGMDTSGYVPFWHPRTFLKLPGMHYAHKHWFLYDYAGRVIENTYPLWASNQFVLVHFKVFRNMRRLIPHMSYMLDMSGTGWQEPDHLSAMQKLEEEVTKTN